jgi:hypothetical protein
VTRAIAFGRRYRRAAEHLGAVPGSERGRAVGRVIAGLASAENLPGSGDTLALIPPTGEAFVRRVPGRNLWLWYKLRADELLVVTLTADPPVPVE